jgi:hypothetical protein
MALDFRAFRIFFDFGRENDKGQLVTKNSCQNEDEIAFLHTKYFIKNIPYKFIMLKI